MNKIDNESKRRDTAVIINFPGGLMNQAVPAPLPMSESIAPVAFPSLPSAPARPEVKRVRKGGKAKTLDIGELQRLLMFIQTTRHAPEADIVKVLLSFYAGLRACEIAGLHISDVTRADGSTADVLQVRPNVTKGGRGREVPVCQELRQAIDAFRAKYPRCEWLAVSVTRKRRIQRHQDANAVTVFFYRLFQEAGLEGCSSHSGRRSFITWACRNLPEGCSLRDVQVLVGHARLDTTEAYIDCSPNARSLVDRLGAAFSRGEGEGAE